MSSFAPFTSAPLGKVLLQYCPVSNAHGMGLLVLFVCLRTYGCMRARASHQYNFKGGRTHNADTRG